MTARDWALLPCGTDPARLLVYAAEEVTPGAPSHELGCPYCQTAIGELTEMWRPVREWAGREVQPPRHFVATVMQRVRRLVQSPRHAAAISARGSTTVTSWVLGLIVAAAVTDTTGVAGITGTPSYARRPLADRYGADGIDIAELGERDVSVALGITARPDPSLATVASDVRRNVMAAVNQHAGIDAVEINISIDDLDLT